VAGTGTTRSTLTLDRVRSKSHADLMDSTDLPPFMTFASKDPAVRLRCVEPTKAPPYQSLDLLLKQCDLQDLDPAAQQAFTLFSSFSQAWEQNLPRHMREAKQMLASLSPRGGEYELRADTRPDRRFSGDGNLSRARYFSLCRDNGLDGGTMLRELTSYNDPMGEGPVEIDDLTEGPPLAGDPSLGAGASSREGRRGILISIPPYTAMRYNWLRGAVRRWETTTVLLPVRTTRERFERLIDVRNPRVASWFTRELTRLCWIAGDGSEARAFPTKKPLDEFADLLPSLMAQDHGGGNGATRIAGQWLRTLGADALVFPSARSDSWVEAGREAVRDSYGWNLVDYRGASPARFQTFDMTPAWPTQVSNEIYLRPLGHQADIFLERKTGRRGRGSWYWHNIEESNLAARHLASALYLYEWAWDGVTDEQRKEFGLLLGATGPARSLAQISTWTVRALLGDESVRRAIAQSIAEALTPEQAQLINLAGTFARMDARLAAGRTGGLG
jgi:hypothetical protein